MIRKILVPTDFSEPSVRIANRVHRFKTLGLQEVVLFHALRTIDVYTGELYIEMSYVAEFEEYAKKELDKISKELEGHGIKAETVIETGNPSVLILDVAEREKADLIIMASHGQGKSRNFHMGSVAHSVLHHSHGIHVPVLIKKVEWEKTNGIAKPKFRESQCFTKSVFPTDFSDRSEEALSVLKSFISVGLKEVVLVHVQDTGKLMPHLEDKMEEFDAIDQERLNRIKENLEKLGLEVKTVIDRGVPTEKIVEVSARENADIIVMGAYGRSPVAEFFLGSVSERVAQKSSQAVLVV
ncbi:MAG: universal stress protein [Armatimonadota bacterium]